MPLSYVDNITQNRTAYRAALDLRALAVRQNKACQEYLYKNPAPRSKRRFPGQDIEWAADILRRSFHPAWPR